MSSNFYFLIGIYFVAFKFNAYSFVQARTAFLKFTGTFIAE